MSSTTVSTSPEADGQDRALRAILMAHQAPLLGRSLGQLASTFLPFFGLIAAMYALWDVSPWLSLALAMPAAGLIVRIFIIQHDCGHGSFFRNRAANIWLGRFCSLITMTPFANWRRHHSHHHAVWNNLDHRKFGSDLYSTCLTVEEYQALPARARWWHRLVRHPLIAQLLLPPLVFVFYYRLPFGTPRAWRKERASVVLTDVALVGLVAGLMLLLGVGRVAGIQLPVIGLAGIFGIWLFSVQHRFEDAVWARQTVWSANRAAVLGSSHLRLPRVLQWFTGNIGFHHIHHLMPRIPNYRLQDCHRACARLVSATASLSLWEAIRAPAYALWDEEKSRMVRFIDVARRTPARV